MRILWRQLLRARPTAAIGALVVALGACASSSPAPSRPVSLAEAPVDTLDAEPLPENVATALLLGSALLEGDNPRSALGYYRFAYEAVPGDPEIGRRLVDVALRAGQARVALDTLEDLVERYPDDADLARQRAQLLAMVGTTEQALEAARALIDQDPSDLFALELQADLLQESGDAEGALGSIDRLIEQDPQEPLWWIRRGDLLLGIGRAEEAEQAWRRALELDPGSIDAIDRLSDLMRGQGREDELLAMLEELAAQDVLGPAQQARLADLYLARGDRERTVDLLVPMARRGELEPRARLILADLLASLDRSDEAIEILEALVDEPGHDKPMILRTIGELHLDVGQPQRAVDVLRRAVAADPDDGNAHASLLLAITQADPRLVAGGAPEDAREEFERRLEAARAAVDPLSARQNFVVGAILRRIGRPEQAKPLLAQAAALDAGNEQILYELAVAQETSRDYEGARATLETLLALDPDDPHLKNFYGYLLADQGWELERAEALIRDAVAAEPDNGAYVDSLGWVLFRRGEYEEALDHLIRAVNLTGDDPVVLEHVGECLAALERYDEALRSFERALAVGGPEDRLVPRIEAMREALRENP